MELSNFTIFQCESCLESNNMRNNSITCHKICNYCIFSLYLPSLVCKLTYNDTLNEVISCPVCKALSSEKTEFSEFLEKERIFPLQSTKKYFNKKCESCTYEKIEVYCNVCEIYFCKICLVQKHMKVKKFSNHSLNSNVDNSSNVNMCRCDKDRKIQFICNSCDDYFCINCILLNHYDHNYVSDFHPYTLYPEEVDSESKEMKLINMEMTKKKLSAIKDKILAYGAIPNSNCNSFKVLLQDFASFIERGDTSIADLAVLFDEEFIKIFANHLENFYNTYDNKVKNLENIMTSTEKEIFLVSDMAENLRNLIDGKLHPKIEIRSFNSVATDYLKDKLDDFEKRIYSNTSNNFNSFKNEYIPQRIKFSDKTLVNKRKLLFKGQKIRKFTGQTIAVSSKMSNDRYPNMFVVFRNHEGKSFVGWINYYFNQIELFDFTSGEPYTVNTQNDSMNKKLNNSSFMNNSQVLDANSFLSGKNSLKLSKMQLNSGNKKSSMTDSSLKKKASTSEKYSRNVEVKSNMSFSVKEGANQSKNLDKNSNAIMNINKKKMTLFAHNDTIYCLRHYIIDREHFLLTCSKDNFVKLWECKYFTECFCVNNNANARSGVILKFKNVRYIVVCSYTKDYPINAYDSQGVLCRQFVTDGYSYHLDFFEHNNKTYLFNSTYPYFFNVYDFESCNIIFSYKTMSYVNSIIVTPFEMPLVTFLDRSGNMTQLDLLTGEILRENSGAGYYGMCKWNERYYIVCGKGLGFNIIDLNTFSTVDWYDDLHKESISSVIKYRHPEFGDVLLTYGEDQIIKLYK